MTTIAKPDAAEPLTYESVLKLIHDSTRQFMESLEASKAEREKERAEYEAKRKEDEAKREKEKIEAEAKRKEDEAKREKEKIEYEAKREKERKEAEKERKASEKAWNKRFAEFGDRIGELVEEMVEGGIVRKFRELGYDFDSCSRRKGFINRELEIDGEIDLFVENGAVALLVEVKLNLTVSDVREHIERMEKFRQYSDVKGDKRKFIAAVGGGVVRKNVREFAMKNGIYVIVQSGETTEIVETAKGFKARKW
jgi:flagellar biosynthesis GTPase FlhF